MKKTVYIAKDCSDDIWSVNETVNGALESLEDFFDVKKLYVKNLENGVFKATSEKVSDLLGHNGKVIILDGPKNEWISSTLIEAWTLKE